MKVEVENAEVASASLLAFKKIVKETREEVDILCMAIDSLDKKLGTVGDKLKGFGQIAKGEGNVRR